MFLERLPEFIGNEVSAAEETARPVEDCILQRDVDEVDVPGIHVDRGDQPGLRRAEHVTR